MKAINEKIVEYFSIKTGVVAVYLYGSYASGKQTDKSDLDLAIIMDSEKISPAQYFNKRDQFMLELSRILRKELHVVLLNHAGEGLLQQVLKKGELVYISNKQKLNMFKPRILQQIFEFNYYRNRMQSGFIRYLRTT